MAEWREFVMETYKTMKQSNPRVTLGDAMQAAKEPYKERRGTLYHARKVVAAGYRRKAQGAAGDKKAFYEGRAHKTEVAQYAGMLEDLAAPWDRLW
jgi:hypothetical protein